VLLTCACLAAVGLFFLSQAAGALVLVAATIYGVGKTFFWPVTLGVVAERFPKGGALTLNAMGGCGMLGVGIIGSQLLGFWQDTNINRELTKRDPQAHARLMAKEEKHSVFGTYTSLDQGAVNKINDQLALAKKREGADLAKLAQDPEYQTLVRNAYDHLIRKEGDTAEKTHDAMTRPWPMPAPSWTRRRPRP
jgi:ATP-dependent exoDNAse (exonuclease V) alpha subunit